MAPVRGMHGVPDRWDERRAATGRWPVCGVRYPYETSDRVILDGGTQEGLATDEATRTLAGTADPALLPIRGARGAPHPAACAVPWPPRRRPDDESLRNAGTNLPNADRAERNQHACPAGLRHRSGRSESRSDPDPGTSTGDHVSRRTLLLIGGPNRLKGSNPARCANGRRGQSCLAGSASWEETPCGVTSPRSRA